MSHASPFERFPDVYDAIYAARGKDYAAESRFARARIDERAVRPVRSLLDVACGTGEHLRHFGADLEVAGVDASPAMLAAARRKVPGAHLHEADMRSFDLGRRFDAVTCLFASVAYLPDEAGLRRAVAAMSRHVAPGGALVLEPGVTPEELEPPEVEMIETNAGESVVGRRADAAREGDALLLRFFFWRRLRDGALDATTHAEELHRLRLFRHEQYRAAFAAARLEHRYVAGWPGPRGLYVAWPSGQPAGK